MMKSVRVVRKNPIIDRNHDPVSRMFRNMNGISIPFTYKGEVRLYLNDNKKTEVIVSNPYFDYNNGKVRFSGYQTTQSGTSHEVSYELHPDMLVGFDKT